MSAEEKAAIRVISENSYLGFLRSYFQLLQGEKWGVNWHHRMIAAQIEGIVSGKKSNTIFNVPPGSGKTEMLSIHAPVWALMKVNKIRNLQISSGNTLANRNSRRMKGIIKSKEFRENWQFEFGVDQAEEWTLIDEKGKPRAEIVSRPMQGQIVGSRGGYIGPEFSGWINLDDPDKPSDMFSGVRRKKNHETAINTIRSRRGDKSKKHPTPILLTQQRLHSEDLTWFFMSGGMGIDFEQIKIPALINEAYIESLPEPFKSDCIKCVCDSEQINGYWSFWPENEDVNDLMSLWESDQYTFMSQYMQEPESLSGGIFSADAFKYYSENADDVDGTDVLMKPPYWEYRFITADTAQKTKEHNDFSVLCEWGVYQGRVYLLDILRGKWEAPDLKANTIEFITKAVSRTAHVDGRLRSVNIEDKASGTGLIQEINNVVMRLGASLIPIQRHRDKFTRAMDVQSHQLAGKVVLPYGDTKNPEFISEVASFTPDDSHKHDDQTDNMIDALEIGVLRSITGNDFSGLL